MRDWMEIERAALVTTLRTADPDAPTLCAGWSVRHVVAHLVLREHTPLRKLADDVMRREPGTEHFLSRAVDTARTERGYRELVDLFAAGPAPRSAMGLAGDRANFLEYVIHHEDVRRGGDAPAEPRTLPAATARAVWAHLAPLALLGYRTSPVGVVLAVPGGPRRVARRGPDAVVVVGEPVELALHATGRERAADVAVRGRPEIVAAFERSR
ncbi:MAG: TIGR03085 family metal-binding protein [Georgenia sp.]